MRPFLRIMRRFMFFSTCAGILLLSALTTGNATPIPSEPPGGGGIINDVGATPGDTPSWVGNAGGVNTGTGNKMISVPIVGWTARGGLPVSLSLCYNSLSLYNGATGPKWSTSYDEGITTDGSGDVTVVRGDGSACTFTNLGSGNYSNPPGVFDKLSVVSGNYTITSKNQDKFTFQTFGSQTLLTSIADENGNVIAIARNSDGTLNTVTDPTNRKITFGYRVSGSIKSLISITDPMSRVWTLRYTTGSQPTLYEVIEPTLDAYTHACIFTYDTGSLINGMTDLDGNSSTFHCNSDGTLAWEQDPAGNRTSFTYGTTTTTITDPNGHTRVDTYDANGRRTATKDALGNTETLTYDSYNDITADKDRNGYTWTLTYDANGNVLTSQSPHNAAQSFPATAYTYNSHNKMTSVELPGLEGGNIAYDSCDNPISIQQHDSHGNVLATTTVDYPNLGGSATHYGLPDFKIDANGNKTLYGYDGNYYLSSVTSPLGHKTQWVRASHLDAVTARTDALGNNTSVTYDNWLRATAVAFTNHAYNCSYGYDYNSNLTSFGNYAGNYTRSYDSDGRLLEEALGGTVVLSHTYDASGKLGLLSTTTDASGRAITYGYSARNELASVAEASGTAGYTYDNDGNQVNDYDENGTQNQTYWRDENDRLTKEWNQQSDGNVLTTNNLTYDADGQITNTVDGYGSSTTYGYDGLLHLASEVRTGYYTYNRSYVVDGVGDRTSMIDGGIATTLLRNADNEHISDPSGFRTYAYDANGNQTSYTVSGQSPSAYGYDPDNSLISIAYGAGGGVTFAYDALGRQVSRTAGGVTYTYYYDGANIIDEWNGSAWTQHTWGNGEIRQNGEYSMYDGLGSVMGMTNASQTQTEQAAWDAFGRQAGGWGSSSDPYQYKSEYGYRSDGDGDGDGQTIIKVGARYYDPVFGDFITRDADLTQSPYAYCNGDPLNSVDPTGYNPASYGFTEANGNTVTFVPGTPLPSDYVDLNSPNISEDTGINLYLDKVELDESPTEGFKEDFKTIQSTTFTLSKITASAGAVLGVVGLTLRFGVFGAELVAAGTEITTAAIITGGVAGAIGLASWVERYTIH